MPALNCTNPVIVEIARDNARVDITVQLTYDGVSTPPNCDGTISAVVWRNDSPNTWYAHFPNATKGPAAYRLDPGTSGTETRQAIFTAGGFSNRASVFTGLDLDQNPPAQGERLLN